MLKAITEQLVRDTDYPARQFQIKVLNSVLEGELYDHLNVSFHEEKDAADEYIPLRQRRPSVRYNLSKIIVDDSVSLLFSEGHFPEVECEDETTKEALALLIKDAKLNVVMIDAATKGSVGSVAVLLRILSNRVFLDVMCTEFLTPCWKAEEPDVLEMVCEQYKVKGYSLIELGYKIRPDEKNVDFWWKREWTDQAEVYYLPVKVTALKEGTGKWVEDKDRTVNHGFGFVPVVWVKNLPGGKDTEGACTFKEAIDTQIEIEYLLSQGGRGLKYSSDPTLMLKEPAMGEAGRMVKGAGNAIVVGQEGDAKLLEINGTAAEAVIAYFKALREAAIEACHGNRTSADKISAAQSGRAMELMNQALIWLADRLRITYGEGALLDILNMVIQARRKFKIVTKKGAEMPELSTTADLSLRWPDWYAPTFEDKQSQATALKTHTEAGHMSTKTATKTIAATYDIEDADQESADIETERQARAKEALELAQSQTKLKGDKE